mgnify:CR=1 FL=1|tara:strand:- start:1197 stop:1391 length:195 start_codon:yes stop_codon:yes gene_type:complete
MELILTDKSDNKIVKRFDEEFLMLNEFHKWGGNEGAKAFVEVVLKLNPSQWNIDVSLETTRKEN